MYRVSGSRVASYEIEELADEGGQKVPELQPLKESGGRGHLYCRIKELFHANSIAIIDGEA